MPRAVPGTTFSRGHSRVSPSNTTPRCNREGHPQVSTALVWDNRFGVHDMGDAALYLPPGGLVESDRHIDSVYRGNPA